MGETFGFFTLVALVIASMGLFGLAAYSAEQRTKEIGIRKVLGASGKTILAIFSKDFFRMVTLAFFLSMPIAWLGMNQWLKDFAYRIDMEWWIFALAFVLALLITGITVSYQSIKSARVNPVDSLKSE
jgi:putative ABC transport system permease protein